MSPRLIAPYGCFAITLAPLLRLLVPYGLVAITVSSAYGDCVVRTLQCYGGTLLLSLGLSLLFSCMCLIMLWFGLLMNVSKRLSSEI